MIRTSMQKLTLTALAVLATGGALMAQDLKVAPPRPWVGPVVPYRDASPNWPGAPIFTNLGPTTANLYDFNAGGYYVLGINNTVPDAGDDQWLGVSFWTGTSPVTARRLQAAILQDTVAPGTNLRVNLSIYTDNAGAPGTPVPGGTRNNNPVPVAAPNVLITANLAGGGAALAANTKYWLVATTSATSDLGAVWYASNNAQIGANLPSLATGWFMFSGLTPAGAVLP